MQRQRGIVRMLAGPSALALGVMVLVFVATLDFGPVQAATPRVDTSLTTENQPPTTLGQITTHIPAKSSTLLPATLILIGIVGRHTYKKRVRKLLA